MKRKLLIGLLFLALIAVPLFAVACEEEEPPPAQQEEEEQPPAEEEEEGEGNWWDYLGEPEYDGTITVRTTVLSSGFDLDIFSAEHHWFFWWESLFINDQTIDPEVYPFQTGITPKEYYQGILAESWEFQDPVTIVVHLREGIHYVDLPPANGREFTAEDVQYHYDRVLGTGSGFTEPNPQYAPFFSGLEKAVATDTYTVVFTLKEAGALTYNYLTALGNQIECRESVELGGGKIIDWETAVGTGPYILTDVVSGQQYTYSKNTDYWGYDERHPENQLPYADTIKVVMIPDIATAMAAMRTGQIDILTGLDWRDAQSLLETNSELQQFIYKSGGHTLEMRYNLAPFNDIRVRTALQMAMNLEEINQSHYGGTVDSTPCGHVTPYWEGYCYPYEEWPQSLKDEYAYDPEGAKELLAEAAADGVFEVNEYGGFDTTCKAPINTDLELLQIMQGYLMDIGIDMEIETMDFLAFQAAGRAGQFEELYFHVFPNSGWTVLHSSITLEFTPTCTRNYGQVYEEEFVQLNDEFLAATDLSQLAPIVIEYDKISIEKHVRIWTFNINNYVIFQPWLRGFSGQNVIAHPYVPGWPLARMWIDSEIKQSYGY